MERIYGPLHAWVLFPQCLRVMKNGGMQTSGDHDGCDRDFGRSCRGRYRGRGEREMDRSLAIEERLQRLELV